MPESRVAVFRTEVSICILQGSLLDRLALLITFPVARTEFSPPLALPTTRVFPAVAIFLLLCVDALGTLAGRREGGFVLEESLDATFEQTAEVLVVLCLAGDRDLRP